MNIKNLLCLLTICLSFAFTSVAQENYATAKSADMFVTANSQGIFEFILPEKITKDDVAVSSEFYTMYFKVEFNENSHLAKITMLENEDKAKHVMVRFFVSLGLREIMYSGSVYPVEDFYKKFLRTEETGK